MTSGRLLIDLSFFRQWRRNSSHFTGIPRVIFETANRLASDPAFEVVTVYYDPSTQQFVAADAALLHPEPDLPVDHDVSSTGSLAATPMRLARGVWYRTHRVRSALRRIPGLPGMYRGLRRRYARGRGAITVDFRRDDTLLLLDSLWGISQILPVIEREHRDVGFTVATLIYDIIPVDYPHLVTPEATEIFENFLRYALRFSDQLFAISEASKRAVMAYCERESIPLTREVIAAPLGEGYDNPHDERRPEGLPDGDFVIAVSTFEPRKNYQILYEAVKHAELTDLPLPRIVIVGRPGWLTDDLQHLVRTDPATQDSLIWLDRVSDNELAWLYENALFTVFPSIAEGWGLPVSESIHFGKFCISSDQASLPEIAGDLIDYISPFDAAGWAESISLLANNRDLLAEKTERMVREYTPRTWESFVEIVTAGISALERADSLSSAARPH